MIATDSVRLATLKQLTSAMRAKLNTTFDLIATSDDFGCAARLFTSIGDDVELTAWYDAIETMVGDSAQGGAS